MRYNKKQRQVAKLFGIRSQIYGKQKVREIEIKRKQNHRSTNGRNGSKLLSNFSE